MTRLVAPVLLATTWAATVSAANLSRCAAITDDSRRLACYDELAGWAMRARTSAAVERAKIRDEVIERCQRQMGSYGPAMVKGCVDMDLEAHAVLAGYPSKHKAIVDRCTRQMKSHGWSMVQGCTDMDIEAVRALERMKKR